ncbi:Serine/threonine protein kinase [Handroanthus impetiginosus]|uniref:Serine/threonine protein kinase n=1 Tax=Handroanthus impetiginosus TaxID=429701 RepID=A0A2G9GF98_9LAMI|nr:Serine/threonine protein kinase [Handroanthus impetiginosus]
MLRAAGWMIGKGTFGYSYKAILENGNPIVVKRLRNVNVTYEGFKQHIEVIGRIRHENVAELRTYHFSSNDKYLVYDYYNQDSLAALLCVGENRASIVWETRVKIAIGTARGIAEIYTQNGGELVHGNIKSSNIFLNQQEYGCIPDLGLANMIETTFTTRNVSRASDVYSFGIVLLKLLTRKSTTHLPGGPEVANRVKLVGSAKSKARTAKVFDEDLLKHSTIREEMVKMLQIVIKCVTKSIKKKPETSEVVKILDDIIRLKPESHGPLGKELIFVDNPNPTFDIKDIKRLRNLNVSCEDFQQHTEVIVRMRHENVAELKAYHFSSNDKYLVYDYYNQDSLAALLWETVTNRAPLDWEMRLKITEVAARGIAHIHGQDGGKLVHGNIKSSNIFINEKKYGIVSDVRLAKFIVLRYLNEEAMVQLLPIAMHCVAIAPESRPRIPEVVKMLEETNGIDLSNESSLEGVLEDTWGQPPIESRLEDILEGLSPKLTP